MIEREEGVGRGHREWKRRGGGGDELISNERVSVKMEWGGGREWGRQEGEGRGEGEIETEE